MFRLKKQPPLSNETIIVPSFQIGIELSEEAEIYLQEEKETIVVRALFYGYPRDKKLKDWSWRKYGELHLKWESIELNESRIANFSNCEILKDKFDWLEDKNFMVLINIHFKEKENRKKYEEIDQYINFEILEEPIGSIAGKLITLKGRLIKIKNS